MGAAKKAIVVTNNKTTLKEAKV